MALTTKLKHAGMMAWIASEMANRRCLQRRVRRRTKNSMKKIIRIEMPDGSLWDVPAEIVAHNRAKYYADKDTGETCGEKHTKAYLHELEYTLRDDDELTDWAANNMNWEDVQASATMYQAGSCDYQEGWVNGHKTIIVAESSNAALCRDSGSRGGAQNQ